MKKIFITYYTVFSLTVSMVVGVSYAGENVRVFEMADGNIVEFEMTPEEIAAQENKIVKLQRSLSSLRIKPKKNVLVFEMGESGITISFPATEKEAAEQSENPDWSKRYNTLSNWSESEGETVELPESGFYLFFPVSRDDNDETKTQFYSRKPK
jgi:hypothetical protein